MHTEAGRPWNRWDNGNAHFCTPSQAPEQEDLLQLGHMCTPAPSQSWRGSMSCRKPRANTEEYFGCRSICPKMLGKDPKLCPSPLWSHARGRAHLADSEHHSAQDPPQMLQLLSERALPQKGLAPTRCLPHSDTPPHRELSESNATTVPSHCLS